MSEENKTNDDIDYTEFDRFINRFDEHDKFSENLYGEFKSLFDIVLSKSKNVIAMGGNLRDISEMAKSLSSIRGDAITSTSHAFNAKMKVADLKLKKSKTETENDETATTSLLMRKLTESIHTQKTSTHEASKVGARASTIAKTSKDDEGERKLRERLTKELGNGSIKINQNERAMRYDFNGVMYRYDSVKDKVIVLDNGGNVIHDYPDERIPDEHRLKRYENGVAYNQSGQIIKQYEG